MFINIHISSKNYNSLKSFLNFFSNTTFVKKLNLVIFKQTFVNKKEKSFFTVLKSPHVNKSAQERFEYSLYSKQFKIHSCQSLLFLVLLKTLKTCLFSDIKFKVEILVQKSKFKHKIKNKVNPDNFSLSNNNLGLQTYINIWNNYGKLNLKTV